MRETRPRDRASRYPPVCLAASASFGLLTALPSGGPWDERRAVTAEEEDLPLSASSLA